MFPESSGTSHTEIRAFFGYRNNMENPVVAPGGQSHPFLLWILLPRISRNQLARFRPSHHVGVVG